MQILELVIWSQHSREEDNWPKDEYNFQLVVPSLMHFALIQLLDLFIASIKLLTH